MATNKPTTIHTPFGDITTHPARAKSLEKYYQNPQICRTCGVVIPIKDGQTVGQVREKKFCNNSCAATFNNQLREAKHHCLYCGQALKVTKHKRKYCSTSCQKKHEHSIKIQSGVENCSNYVLKRYLLDIRGHQCENCKLETWMGQPITLELEHTDGNSENHDLNNLKLLCPNCHSQTPTYKAKNKGNGRFARRQRYQKGRSY